jgi:hypothetical protein
LNGIPEKKKITIIVTEDLFIKNQAPDEYVKMAAAQ